MRDLRSKQTMSSRVVFPLLGGVNHYLEGVCVLNIEILHITRTVQNSVDNNVTAKKAHLLTMSNSCRHVIGVNRIATDIVGSVHLNSRS